MEKHPIAEMKLADGGLIRMELYPEIAPNAVKSFIYLAKKGVFNHYPIERIVPGWVLDMSYHAFHSIDACYFIQNDTSSGRYLDAEFGTIGMGGYGEDTDGKPYIAGGEFFFPLADCPAITGKYPIFGKVTEGLDVLRRLERVKTYPVPYPDAPDVRINTPVTPVLIDSVRVETFGVEYGAPQKITGVEKPVFWRW